MRARVLTALALIPPVLLAVFCTSPWPILALLLLMVILGAKEIANLIRQPFAYYGAFVLLIIAVAAFYASPTTGGMLSTSEWRLLGFALGPAVFALGVISVMLTNPLKDRKQPIALLASGWILGPAVCLAVLHQAAHHSSLWVFATPVLMAVVPLWAGDTAAIFAGKAFGKHKLAPTISPKKTVEGGIANLIACILAAWGLGVWIGYSVPQSLLMGTAAGLFGQAGDLFESWAKRRVDMKDSGTLLPGHGGIMDRIDSILFTAPLVALILLFWPK